MRAGTVRFTSIGRRAGTARTTPDNGREHLPTLAWSNNASRVPSAKPAKENFRAAASPLVYPER
jgi:hypothetical protein